jgi:predicted ATPase with chaperone activity
MKPCPCGSYIDLEKECVCLLHLDGLELLEKISHPLLDRIDI